MGRIKQPFLEKVHILDIGADGKSIAKVNDLVIFVDKVVPGDVVDVRITKKKKNFAEAIPTHFHVYSPDRTQPFCSHFGLCGGCKWQHLPYEKQLFFKQKQVMDALERIGKVALPACKPILPSQQTDHYRNKLEFTCTNSRWLMPEEMASGEELERKGIGFHIPKKFDKVLDISKCYLQEEPSNSIRLAIKEYALAHNFDFYDLYKQEGFLRNVMLRTSSTGQVMIVVQFAKPHMEAVYGLLDFIATTFPQVSSLFYVINQKRNDTLYDQEIVLYKGQDHILEQMEDLYFKVGPKSFYQTNSAQAYQLYKIVRQMAGLTHTETVLDLYTGTGTIALFLARQARQVIGMELVPEAIEDARQNAILNKIDNANFFAGDIKDLLKGNFEQMFGIEATPDVLVVDPPRAGMHPDVVEAILALAPPKIIYVSCNPATQARDIALMDDCYQVKEIQPVDMFPHTTHVENVLLLSKK